MSELNQLLLNFNQKQNFNYNDYYVSKSNYFAFKLIDSWPKWQKNILNIYGEKGSGKSHLIGIFESKHKSKKFFAKNFDDEILTNLKIHQNIICEDLNEIKNEKLLYSLFNLIIQDNKYLIITSEIPLITMSFELNDLKSRVKNCLFAEIEKPDDELIFALILKYFSDKQINIEKKLIDYIVKRVERSYRKISEFIYKVDEISLKKKKPIDLKTIREIL